jgi:tetratricopeptide (TPR) repeat protein
MTVRALKLSQYLLLGMMVITSLFAAAQSETQALAEQKAQAAKWQFDLWQETGQRKAWDEAWLLSNEAQKLDPKNVLALVLQARKKIAWARRGGMQGNWAKDRKEAFALIEQALAIDPKHPEALRIAGRMQHLDSQYDKARQYYDKAAAVRAVWPTLALNYALLEDSMDSDTEQFIPIDKASHTRGAQASKWYRQIEALVPVEADGKLNINVDPASRSALLRAKEFFASQAIQIGNIKQVLAILDAEKTITLPQDGPTRVNVAYLYLKADLHKEAIATAEEALRLGDYAPAKNTIEASYLCMAWQSHLAGDTRNEEQLLELAFKQDREGNYMETFMLDGSPKMKAAAEGYAYKLRWIGIKQNFKYYWKSLFK